MDHRPRAAAGDPGFSLSGYLLPWDQKAYWATTVTISVAESSPVVGGLLADVLRGGSELGALTLGRWYAAHVFLLPAALLVFVVAHIALMRKHGISGPITPRAGPPIAFYPWHVIKDTVMMAAVFALLLTVAVYVPGAPRRDRQPGRRQLRAAAGVVLPVAVPAAEVLSRAARSSWPRRWCRAWSWAVCSRCRSSTAGTAAIRGRRRGGCSPSAMVASSAWHFGAHLAGPARCADALRPEPVGTAAHRRVSCSPRASRRRASRCHVEGGPASPVRDTRISRDDGWLVFHMSDPEAIAPGARPAGRHVRPDARRRPDAGGAGLPAPHCAPGGTPPTVSPSAASVMRHAGHAVRGLPHVRRRRRRHRARPDPRRRASRRGRDPPHHHRPNDEYGDSMMPVYGSRLSAGEIAALARLPGRAQVAEPVPATAGTAPATADVAAASARALVTRVAGDAAERVSPSAGM